MSDIAPVSPAESHRGLLALVIGLGALFVIAIVVAIALAATRRAPAPLQAFALPKGAVVVAMESEPSRLILRLRVVSGEGRAGEEIDIVDTTDGHLVARIK